jgi:hypothetical protein
MAATVTAGLGEGAKALAARGGRTTLDITGPELDGFPAGYATIRFGDDEHGPLALLINLAGDLEFAPHYHDTDQCFVVLEGSIRVGRTWYGPGSVRVQDAGAVYGPLVTGPDGCRAIAFFCDRSEWPDQFASERDRLRNDELMTKFHALFDTGRPDAARADAADAEP